LYLFQIWIEADFSLASDIRFVFGLLINLVSVPLGNWLAKLQALRTKWNINSGSDDKEVAARRDWGSGPRLVVLQPPVSPPGFR
jgi:hypothetical protein